MKEFIEKLINELEKLEEHCLYMNNWQGQTAICDAIEIVNQLAEEYGKDTNVRSNDWIPCKVGDTVYTVCAWGIESGVVGSIEIFSSMILVNNTHGALMGEVKNIYLTREEAERVYEQKGKEI